MANHDVHKTTGYTQICVYHNIGLGSKSQANLIQIQGCSQPFLIEGSKLFSKSLLYTARHKFWHQLRKQLATPYNERHLVYDYSHYIVKIKLVTTYAS